MNLSKQTAFDIWCAHDEIAKGEKLLEDMKDLLRRGEQPDLRDAFGRQRNLQLGIPSGESAHRLLDVKPELAIAVIQAHIADKKAVLDTLSIKARLELGSA